MLPRGIGHYDFDSVNKAPEAPGIYAWYAKLSAGLADWRRVLGADQKTDLGESNFRKLLLLHSKKFDPMPYDVVAKSSFELVWSGKLEPQLADSFDRILNEGGVDTLDEQQKEEARQVQQPFKKEKTRCLLAEL